MGDPGGDVERLRQVLELCAERGLKLARVRVGGVELALSLSPPPAQPGSPPTPEEIRERSEREFEELMYAASRGDVPWRDS